MKNKTICIGTRDIVSGFRDLRRGFNDAGWDVITVVGSPSTSPFIQRDNYDYILYNDPPAFSNEVRNAISKSNFSKLVDKAHFKLGNYISKNHSKKIFEKVCEQCDYFMFYWSSFDYNFDDLKTLKKLGKKIIVVFCGDDVRWYYSMKQDFEANGLKPYSYGEDYDYSVTGLEQRLRRIRYAEKYADIIYSRREQAQLQLRPFYHYPTLVSLEDFEINTTQRKIPVVVHAPSHSGVKGTLFVIEAFERLKNEGIEFTPVLLENKPNKEATKIYADADILIDQLLIPGGGKVTAEAMACGTIVITRMAYGHYEQGFSLADCPIVDAGPESIYEQLKKLILDYDKRVSLAKQSRSYAEKYFDVNKFCVNLIDRINNQNNDFDYEPVFFRNEFIPESNESLKVYNKWNRFAAQSEWYKKSVQRGTRNGLIF